MLQVIEVKVLDVSGHKYSNKAVKDINKAVKDITFQ